jgi:tetratricopeptide (TPR) repeat protein
MAYNEIIESIGPDDFYIIKRGVVPQAKSMTTKEILTFLRFTVWDARTFLECYNILLERLASEEDFPKEELVAAIHNVWKHYFPIGEEGDLAYYSGTILAYLGYDNDALKFFESSIEFYGLNPDGYYEIALCYYNSGQLENALEYVESSLALDPDFEECRNLKGLIEDLL